MFCKIIKIYKEEHIREEFVKGFWMKANYMKVDLEYEFNGVVKRAIFRFNPKSWQFDREYGMFLI